MPQLPGLPKGSAMSWMPAFTATTTIEATEATEATKGACGRTPYTCLFNLERPLDLDGVVASWRQRKTRDTADRLADGAASVCCRNPAR